MDALGRGGRMEALIALRCALSRGLYGCAK